MIIELTEKEFTSIMAAGFVLRKSREVKNGGTYVENVFDVGVCRRIPLYEASLVLDKFIDRILEAENK